MSLALNVATLAAFLAFCRIGACFLVMPGMSSARIPVQVRLFIAIAVSFALLGQIEHAILPKLSSSLDVLVLLIASELIVGVMIGLGARFYVLALQFIGTGIANLIGYGAMGGIAIEENEPQAALAQLISLSALLLLFAMDFHHEMIKALINSYQLIPVEGVFDAGGALANLNDQLSQAFMVMLRLGSPFIAYAILVNLAIGFINKLTPQIPIYFISLPFVITGGMLLIYFGASSFLSLFGDAFLPVALGP